MNSSSLHGGTAVVTGAGSGFGAAMALRFASAGMNIVALDIDAERVEQAAQGLRNSGVKVITMKVDVGDRTALVEAAKVVDTEFGTCNILYANVGVQQFGAIDRLSEQ